MTGGYSNQLKIVRDRARLEPINPDAVYDGTNGVWNWFEDINNVRMSSDNPAAPRAQSANSNDRISDRYIEDGSYLRIKNITLGYTMPDDLTRKLHLSNVRVYVNIQNIYTFTKYTGFDPEIGVNPMAPNVYGMDFGRYPMPTIYSAGLNFAF
jgi:hypothetical protein